MGKKSKRIYIAGPYNPVGASPHDASRIAQKNVDAAIEIFHRLKAKGHYPFVPHLSHYLHVSHLCPEDYGAWWYEFDMTFLDHWAEALYFIAPSTGASAERERAEKNGLDVYCSLEEVPEAKE